MAHTISITIEDKDHQQSFEVEGTHWAKDDDGNRYVYDEDGDTVAEVSGGFDKVILTRQ